MKRMSVHVSGNVAYNRCKHRRTEKQNVYISDLGRGFVYWRAVVHYLVRALAVLSKGSQRVYGMDW